MTDTRALIADIPTYMVGIIATRLLGRPADAQTLSDWLDDAKRLRTVLGKLSAREHAVLQDILTLGGHVPWHVFLRTYRQEINAVRAILERLGRLGLIFQGGLTGRDPVVLLPALVPFLEQRAQTGGTPDAGATWKAPQHVSIWPHIVMLNALRTVKIRCRPGMEPFKKGWETLEQRLGAFIDIRRVYWELEVLGCVRETKGMLEVIPSPALAFAMAGELRYRVWRFIQSCRPYQGLDGRVFALLRGPGLARADLERAIFLYLVQPFPEMDAIDHVPAALTSLWLELGILQEDSSAVWVRYAEGIGQALASGDTTPPLTAYKDEVIIQPNMEILVSQDFDPVDHLNIGEVADLIQADVISIYCLTRASVFRACREGWDTTKIAQFLDRISKHAVPENVLKTVAGWTSSLSQAHIIQGTFLVIDNCREKLPHGLAEVLPGIYRVPERCAEDLATYLDRKGVIIRRNALQPEEEEMDWGHTLPLKVPEPAPARGVQKDGLYPFGMLMPVPYGHKGVEIFEQATAQGTVLVLLYPKHGYGEIQAYRIQPVDVFTRGGVASVEAVIEDSGESEVFELGKIRAYWEEDAAARGRVPEKK